MKRLLAGLVVAGSLFLGCYPPICAVQCDCAPGVTVVGIDNGYGAACAALRIVNA